MELPMVVNLKMSSTNVDILTFSSITALSKDIVGEIELVFELNRCTFDMKTCEKYPGLVVRNLCKTLFEKGNHFSIVLERSKPPIRCPLKAGNYTLEETKIDLAFVSMFPLDGYVWVTTFKFLSSEPGSKKKQIVMCLNAETKIFRSNIRKP